MKLYHTETQEDYDALMVELEERGAKWYSGAKAVDRDIWYAYKECTCILLEDNMIECNGIEFCKEHYPDIPIQKYKANKGYNALIKVINENIHFCQSNIEMIMNENILGRFLHRKYLSYWEGKIDAYQELLLQIEVRKPDYAKKRVRM